MFKLLDGFFIGCSCFRKFFVSIWILWIKIFYFHKHFLNFFIFLLNFIFIGLVWFCKGFYLIWKFIEVILILSLIFFFLFKCFHHHFYDFFFLVHYVSWIFNFISMKNMEETLDVIDIWSLVLIKLIFYFFLLISDWIFILA